MRIGCCSMSEFKRTSGPEGEIVGGWDAVKLGDGSHMKEGSTRDWGFEDIVIDKGQVWLVTIRLAACAHMCPGHSGSWPSRQ